MACHLGHWYGQFVLLRDCGWGGVTRLLQCSEPVVWYCAGLHGVEIKMMEMRAQEQENAKTLKDASLCGRPCERRRYRDRTEHLEKSSVQM
jgi:hypothetical protein